MAYGDKQVEGYGEEGPGVVFHYKRGSFREREPESARETARQITERKRGIFRVFLGTKGNRTMFVVMVMAVVIVIVTQLFMRGADENVIGGLSCTVTAFSFEGQVYASMQVSPAGRRQVVPQTRVLDVRLEAVDSDGAVSDARDRVVQVIVGGGQDAEPVFVRETFTDYDIAMVRCVVSSGGDQITIRATVQVH